MIRTEYSALTGTTVEIDFTESDLNQLKADQEEAGKLAAEIAAKAAAKIAIAERLGLTEDELATLLG
jgi:hypothetical protein